VLGLFDKSPSALTQLKEKNLNPKKNKSLRLQLKGSTQNYGCQHVPQESVKCPTMPQVIRNNFSKNTSR
jgi:hypothetical protein